MKTAVISPTPVTRAIIHIPEDEQIYGEHAQQLGADVQRRGYHVVGLVGGEWARLIRTLTDQRSSVVVVTSEVYRSAQAQPEEAGLTTMVILDNQRDGQWRHRAPNRARPVSAERLIDDAVRRWRQWRHLI